VDVSRHSIAYRTAEDFDLPAPLAAHAVSRESLKKRSSGAVIERLNMPDGRAIVLKQIDPALDWMMPETHDPGRAALLWVLGFMDRCPPIVDPALLRIEQVGRTWWLYMRDLTPLLPPTDARFPHREGRRVIEACAALHDAFWEQTIPILADLRDLVSICAPASVERHLQSLRNQDEDPGPFRRFVRYGWEIFPTLVPAELAAAVFAILEQPDAFVRELEAGGTTLVHGDPHFGNVVIGPEQVFFLDWSLAPQAPSSVDFVWFLAQCAHRIDASREQLIDDFRRAEGEHFDQRSLHLAFLLQLVLDGWSFAALTDDDSPIDHAIIRDNLAWWTRAGLETLEHWWAP
jgi:hypothetical protein